MLLTYTPVILSLKTEWMCLLITDLLENWYYSWEISGRNTIKIPHEALQIRKLMEGIVLTARIVPVSSDRFECPTWKKHEQ